MPLYKMEPTEAEPVGWDEYVGFVVRAASPGHARLIAEKAGEADDATKGRWTDPARSTCELVPPLAAPAVVLSAFRAG